MIVCDQATLEPWSPDFSSSAQPSPTWTRVRFAGTELVNTLEWANWLESPVQVRVCDACGTSRCSSGGYVHVSRFGDFVLWTTPLINYGDEFQATEFSPHYALTKLGAIAIPRSTWARWQAVVPAMPQVSQFPLATGRVLADAWALGPGRPTQVSTLPHMLRTTLVACDTITPHEAVGRVERWLAHFMSQGDKPMVASLKTPDELSATLETLYFDGPPSHDWAALAIANKTDYAVLDRAHVLVPEGL